MAATRTCPRCKTENDYGRSNCQSCGGVMLGIEAGLGTIALDPTAPQSRGNPGATELEAAIRERLAKAQNLTPAKKAVIEAALQKSVAARLTRPQDKRDNPPTQSRGRGCAVVLAALGILMAGSVALFLSETSKLQDTLVALLPHKTPPTAQVVLTPPPLPAAPTDVLGDPLRDEVQPDKLGQPLVDARAGGVTLTREQLRPLRSCFRGRGVPSERPMSFGIQIAAELGKQKGSVFAMTDVQVPPAIADCLVQRVQMHRWPAGIYFIDWPADDTWP